MKKTPKIILKKNNTTKSVGSQMKTKYQKLFKK